MSQDFYHPENRAKREAFRRAHERRFQIALAKSEAFFKSTTAPAPLPEVGRVVWSGRKDAR